MSLASSCRDFAVERADIVRQWVSLPTPSPNFPSSYFAINAIYSLAPAYFFLFFRLYFPDCGWKERGKEEKKKKEATYNLLPSVRPLVGLMVDDWLATATCMAPLPPDTYYMYFLRTFTLWREQRKRRIYQENETTKLFLALTNNSNSFRRSVCWFRKATVV